MTIPTASSQLPGIPPLKDLAVYYWLFDIVGANEFPDSKYRVRYTVTATFLQTLKDVASLVCLNLPDTLPVSSSPWESSRILGTDRWIEIEDGRWDVSARMLYDAAYVQIAFEVPGQNNTDEFRRLLSELKRRTPRLVSTTSLFHGEAVCLCAELPSDISASDAVELAKASYRAAHRFSASDCSAKVLVDNDMLQVLTSQAGFIAFGSFLGGEPMVLLYKPEQASAASDFTRHFLPQLFLSRAKVRHVRKAYNDRWIKIEELNNGLQRTVTGAFAEELKLTHLETRAVQVSLQMTKLLEALSIYDEDLAMLEVNEHNAKAMEFERALGNTEAAKRTRDWALNGITQHARQLQADLRHFRISLNSSEQAMTMLTNAATVRHALWTRLVTFALGIFSIVLTLMGLPTLFPELVRLDFIYRVTIVGGVSAVSIALLLVVAKFSDN